jgi:beta-N-acetylhexosaminidase/D-alanyl-D-alanine dipeptidase
LERPDDLVDLRSIIPDVVLDLRYATTNNFTKAAVYRKARCLLRREVAQKLARVERTLRAEQLRLALWDCYRPFAVQEQLWKLVPDGRYVARPKRDGQGRPISGSKHNRGAAVDLTLADLEGKLLVMPTDFDDFSAKARRRRWSREPAERNAARLEAAMKNAGFIPLPTEWWHFDDPNWKDYPLGEEPL